MKHTFITAIVTATMALGAAPAFAECVGGEDWFICEPMNDDPFSEDTWLGCLADEACEIGDGKNRPYAFYKGAYQGYEFSSNDENAPWNGPDGVGLFGGGES
jgi:hypothetical protein